MESVRCYILFKNIREFLQPHISNCVGKYQIHDCVLIEQGIGKQTQLFKITAQHEKYRKQFTILKLYV